MPAPFVVAVVIATDRQTHTRAQSRESSGWCMIANGRLSRWFRRSVLVWCHSATLFHSLPCSSPPAKQFPPLQKEKAIRELLNNKYAHHYIPLCSRRAHLRCRPQTCPLIYPRQYQMEDNNVKSSKPVFLLRLLLFLFVRFFLIYISSQSTTGSWKGRTEGEYNRCVCVLRGRIYTTKTVIVVVASTFCCRCLL